MLGAAATARRRNTNLQGKGSVDRRGVPSGREPRCTFSQVGQRNDGLAARGGARPALDVRAFTPPCIWNTASAERSNFWKTSGIELQDPDIVHHQPVDVSDGDVGGLAHVLVMRSSWGLDVPPGA